MGLQIIYTTLCVFENNRKKKKGFLNSGGSAEEAIEGFEDLTDKENQHFRYRI